MMKKLLLTLALFAPGISAHAAESIFDMGYSSMMAVGVVCTTGTVAQINLTRPTGFTSNVAGYRVQNQDSADAVWIGGPNVSTSTLQIGAVVDFTNLGEKLVAGASAPYAFGKDYARSGTPLVKLYCKAADAAGASAVVLSVVWFGY